MMFAIQLLHIIVCLALIVIVLMQADKGEGLSGAFGGGGSYALFGKRGATGFIAKATTAAAVIFMLTSFGLSYFQGSDRIQRVKSGSTAGVPAPERPAGS